MSPRNSGCLGLAALACSMSWLDVLLLVTDFVGRMSRSALQKYVCAQTCCETLCVVLEYTNLRTQNSLTIHEGKQATKMSTLLAGSCLLRCQLVILVVGLLWLVVVIAAWILIC
eukprot:4326055-Amphidinium_carterae.3